MTGGGIDPQILQMMREGGRNPTQQQQPNEEDDLRFQQPKTLRDTLDELLWEQSECLGNASVRIEGLRSVANIGRRTPGKGPADEYVQAERRTRAQSYRGHTLEPQPLPEGMSSEEMKDRDTIRRYLELENEILGLMTMYLGQEYARNPTRNAQDVAATQGIVATDPKRAAHESLARLLGPAEGSATLPDAAAQRGQQQAPPGPDPMAGQPMAGAGLQQIAMPQPQMNPNDFQQFMQDMQQPQQQPQG